MKPYERVIFFIIMTGLWGATTVLILLGIPFTIIDSLFGTDLTSILEMIMSGGTIGLFKLWLCGLPFSFLTDMHKRR
ncbi:hypothetical protein N9349_04615 [Candidatus Pelagibacter sp.]|jgi:hypothetical protein|nr:hypothetical protein [Candidatus Pelagibacter sp.]